MNIIKNTLKNQYITTFISIVILLYSATIDTHITNIKFLQLKLYTKLFNHYLSRLMFLLLIVYIFNYDTKIALSLSIAFIMVNISITNNMEKNSLGQFEHFLELEHFTQKSLLSSLKSKK